MLEVVMMDIIKIIISQCRIEYTDSKNRISDFLSRVESPVMTTSNDFRGVPSFAIIKGEVPPMSHNKNLKPPPWRGHLFFKDAVGQVGRIGQMRQMKKKSGDRLDGWTVGHGWTGAKLK
jgi:hypothetical protein